MRYLAKVAPITGLCSFALGVYAAFGRGDGVMAGICVAVVLASLLMVIIGRAASPQDEKPPTLKQSQRAGAHSTNIQAGRDIGIGGGKGSDER
jgi:hypothetical protein